MKILALALLLSGCAMLDDQEDNTVTMKSVLDDVGSICECTYGVQKAKRSKDSVVPRILK